MLSKFEFSIAMFFISVSGDVMCLHQLENDEPVEFGEIGIDPVERDQVTPFIHSQDICIVSYSKL